MIPMTAELKTFVDIDAPPKRVWQVLVDLPAYAEWNPFITRADGAFVEGQRVSVSAPPVSAFIPSELRPIVREVVPPRRLCVWSRLDRFGIPGLFGVEHTMTILERDGGARLWQQDRFGGLLAPLLINSLNRHRMAAFTAMNVALKQRVEGTPVVRPGP
jgi:hypothetical protein